VTDYTRSMTQHYHIQVMNIAKVVLQMRVPVWWICHSWVASEPIWHWFDLSIN